MFSVFSVLPASKSGVGGGGRGGGMMRCIVGFINCSLSGFQGRCQQIRASVACSADAMDTTCNTGRRVTFVTTRVYACFQIKKKDTSVKRICH